MSRIPAGNDYDKIIAAGMTEKIIISVTIVKGTLQNIGSKADYFVVSGEAVLVAENFNIGKIDGEYGFFLVHAEHWL